MLSYKNRAINAISRLGNLQELNLDVRNMSANKSFHLFSNGKLKNLKILHLGQYGNGLNKRVLFTIANECPSLEYLDINDKKNIRHVHHAKPHDLGRVKIQVRSSRLNSMLLKKLWY